MYQFLKKTLLIFVFTNANYLIQANCTAYLSTDPNAQINFNANQKRAQYIATVIGFTDKQNTLLYNLAYFNSLVAWSCNDDIRNAINSLIGILGNLRLLNGTDYMPVNFGPVYQGLSDFGMNLKNVNIAAWKTDAMYIWNYWIIPLQYILSGLIEGQTTTTILNSIPTTTTILNSVQYVQQLLNLLQLDLTSLNSSSSLIQTGVYPFQLPIQNTNITVADLWLSVNIAGTIYVLMNNANSGLNVGNYTLINNVINPLQQITEQQFSQGILFNFLEINNEVWVYVQLYSGNPNQPGTRLAVSKIPGLTTLPDPTSQTITWSGSFFSQTPTPSSNVAFLFTSSGSPWPTVSTIPAPNSWLPGQPVIKAAPVAIPPTPKTQPIQAKPVTTATPPKTQQTISIANLKGQNLNQVKKLLNITSIATAVQATNYTTMPWFNINFPGMSTGYAFVTNPWGGSGIQTALDYTKSYNFNWEPLGQQLCLQTNGKGLEMILIALDKNKNYIAKPWISAPTFMALFIFDSSGKTLANTPLVFPATNYTQSNGKTPPTITQVSQNAPIEIGGLNMQVALKSYVYPFVLSIPAVNAQQMPAPQPTVQKQQAYGFGI